MAFSSFRVSSLLMLCPLTEICALSFSFLIFQMRITVICRWIVMRIAWDNAWKGFALCLIYRKHSGNISCGDIDSNDDDQDNGFVAKSFKISGFKQIYNQWEGAFNLMSLYYCSLMCSLPFFTKSKTFIPVVQGHPAFFPYNFCVPSMFPIFQTDF